MVYDGLCSKEEVRRRRKQRRVSRWEEEELVAEFCRGEKLEVRSPAALQLSVNHLMKVGRMNIPIC